MSGVHIIKIKSFIAFSVSNGSNLCLELHFCEYSKKEIHILILFCQM